MDEFKIGDWVEFCGDERFTNCDFSIPYQVLGFDGMGGILLNVIGDYTPLSAWKPEVWRLNKQYQFKQIIDEIYNNTSTTS